jgi:hypothetical protein
MNFGIKLELPFPQQLRETHQFIVMNFQLPTRIGTSTVAAFGETGSGSALGDWFLQEKNAFVSTPGAGSQTIQTIIREREMMFLFDREYRFFKRNVHSTFLQRFVDTSVVGEIGRAHV